MPTSVREQCLSAFFDLFAGLSDFPLKKRMPNWTFQGQRLPRRSSRSTEAVLRLGGDDASSGYGGTMRIAIRVSVLAGIRAPQPTDLGAALNAAHADILLAGANKILLAGKAWTQWSGDDDPIRCSSRAHRRRLSSRSASSSHEFKRKVIRSRSSVQPARASGRSKAGRRSNPPAATPRRKRSAFVVSNIRVLCQG